MKKQIVEFLKPEKNKIIATILYPYLLISPIVVVVFLLLIIATFRSGQEEILQWLKILYTNFGILTGIFKFATVFSFVSYPFICALFTIYRTRKSAGITAIFSDKNTVFLVIISLVFFNPLSTLLFTNLFLFMLGSSVDLVDTAWQAEGGVSLFEEKTDHIKILRESRIYHESGLTVERKIVLNKEIITDEDFYDSFSQIRVGDEVFLSSTLKGQYYKFIIMENATGKKLKVSLTDIASIPTPLVQIENISKDSPFNITNLFSNHLLYQVEIYQQDDGRKINLRKFRITNSSEFYKSLSTVRHDEYMEFKLVGGRTVKILVVKNVTDWGIKVKDIQLKRRR